MATADLPRRQPASIIIPVWNAWDKTRACLDALRTSIGPRDEVIVVDNGSTDHTPGGLGAYARCKVVTNATNLGFAAATNQGAAIATNPVLVLLNNDTVPVGRWLDELLAPFADPLVGATGPRSNAVSGPQQVPSANYGGRAELVRFERAWRTNQQQQTIRMRRLVGFCMAVRAVAWEQVGGLDERFGLGGYEDDDLCMMLYRAGWRTLVANRSFVHHEQHATFDANRVGWAELMQQNRQLYRQKRLAEGPLLSAALIVKDEQAHIVDCLQSLRGLVDEIVVGDTGCSDDTVALAQDQGARVLRVPWQDDFAAARNLVLGQCSGSWILSIDADERFVGEPASLRELLLDDSLSDGYAVTIENEMGHGVESVQRHPALRLFRPDMRFDGKIHEQVVDPADPERLVLAPLLPEGSLRHLGYLGTTLERRGKLERNLELARQATCGASGKAMQRAQLDLGRSLLANGDGRGAIAVLEPLFDIDDQRLARFALHVAARASISLEDWQLAQSSSQHLRRLCTRPSLPDLLDAEIAAGQHQYQRALDLIAGVGTGVDDDGFMRSPTDAAQLAILCHQRLGDARGAGEVALRSLRADGVCPTHLGEVLYDMRVGGLDPKMLGACLPAARLHLFMVQLLQADPELALAALEGAYETHNGALVVLATAAQLAPAANVATAAIWAQRVRQRGLTPCPLMQLASNARRSHADRVLAAAVAGTTFADPGAEAVLADLVRHTPPEQRADVEAALRQFAPQLLPLPSLAPAQVAKPGPLASIIIPCLDRAAWTLQCLDSIQRTTPPQQYQLVIVDDGSSDATRGLESSPDASVVVVHNARNLGFAEACNRGAAAAHHGQLIILNNDTVGTYGWLQALLAPLDDDTVGITGAFLHYPSGLVQHAGVGVLHNGDGRGYLDGYNRWARQPDSPAVRAVLEPVAVTGAALAIRAELFKSLGGFDTAYRNGNEDVDLCLRAAVAGWRVVLAPDAELVHFESISGAGRFSHTTDNRQLLTQRWTGHVVPDNWLGGATVVGDFSAPGPQRRLVTHLRDAGVQLVTRQWPRRRPDAVPTWRHAVGRMQPLVLGLMSGELMQQWAEQDAAWATVDIAWDSTPRRLVPCVPGSPTESALYGLHSALEWTHWSADIMGA